MTISGIDNKISGFSSQTQTTQNGSKNSVKFSELLDRTSKSDQPRTRTGFSHLSDKPGTNQYFWRANEDGIINYRGTIFAVDRERNNLLLGDCSNPGKCLRIPLSGGGNLLVNRDNLHDLNNAISMFSAEDIGRILRAIEVDKLAQKNAFELEDEADADILEKAGEADERTAEESYYSYYDR